jgi:hypothetical protein
MVVALAAPAQAQVAGSGTLKGKAYFDLSKGLTEDVNSNMLTFGFRRIYFTYDLQMSDNIKGRFRTDVEQKTDGYYRLYMKHAYADWSAADGLSIRFGQQGTILFGDLEDIWGYRHVAKTMQDHFKIRSSADFGVSFKYGLGDMLALKGMLSNGNGYNKYDDEFYNKAIEFQAVATPMDGLTVAAHYGMNGFDGDDTNTENDPENTGTMDLSVGYEGDAFAVGGSYTSSSNYKFNLDENGSGFWGFGRFSIPNSPMTVIGTYQSWDPDTDVDDNTKTKMLVGLDYTPGKGLSIIPNYVSETNGTDDPVNTFRITFYWKW